MSTWDFSNKQWEDRLRAGKSLLPNLPLDEQEAGRAVAMFDKLKLPDVPGQPRMKEAAGEWQRDLVRAVFGSLVDGARMVREVFCMVPKKNSKTTGGAAITLTGLLMNKRPRAEFIYIGPTQEVADIAFQQTVGMIEADDYLAKRFHIAHHTKTITDRRNKARLKVKTFDMKVVTGSKPSFILLDELHLMSTINGAGRVIGQIRGGMLPNPEAVLIMITTQSDQPPSGAFKAELHYARGVRDGVIKDGRMLPVIYEFPMAVQSDPAKPWRDPANWPMVMPNLGRPTTIDRLISDYQTAREKGDEEEQRWASQHLNVQIGIALGGEWPGAEYWQGAEEPISLESLLRDSDVVTIGIDGGGLDDLLGLAVLGRDKRNRTKWRLWCRAWAHPIVLSRRKEISETLLDFAKDGDLVFCKEATQDIREVADICERIRDAGLLPEQLGIGVDKLGLPAIVDELVERGFNLADEGGVITGVSQGGYLNPAILGAERKLSDGTLKHAGQPLMAWVIGNAKVELKGSSRAITKLAAGLAKIDPLIAAFNAVMLMARNPDAKKAPEFRMLFVG